MTPFTPPCRESVRLLSCRDERLLAVLSEPVDIEPRNLGVVIVVGGPQYRAGSHRQFTRLARELASAGWPTLRFDVRGMGDSEGEFRGFEALSDDIGAAIDELTAARPDLRGVVLWGLCDGASAALLYLHERSDVRVAGLCLVNPWVRSGQTLARTHVKHYYWRRLLQPAFWAKLGSGGVGIGAAREAMQSLRTALARRPGDSAASAPPSFQEAMRRAIERAGCPIRFVLSDQDFVAKEFEDLVAVHPDWQSTLHRPGVDTVRLVGADHTCSSSKAHGQLLRAFLGGSAWAAAGHRNRQTSEVA